MIVENLEKNQNHKEPLLDSEHKEHMVDDRKLGYDIYKKSNCFSKLFFHWAFKILKVITCLINYD